MESLTTFTLALSVCLLCVSSFVNVDAQNRIDEVQALSSFKKAMHLQVMAADYRSHNYWFTWNETDENACKWVGVMCTTNFTVMAVDLSGWELPTPMISVEVFSRLPDLRELDLSGSGMVSFPEDIGSLTHLIRLDLSNNNFIGGEIPQSISACRALRYLSLGMCFLRGAIPDLSALLNLQFLLLADNYLTGPFPKELGKISGLISIDLSGNQLNSFIPSFVSSTNLVNLQLDNNYFTGFEEPFYFNTPSLLYLQIAGNQLEGTIPPAITKLRSVLVIDISGNRLSGNIPPDIAKLRNDVAIINMSGNQLSGNIPSGFSNLISNPLGFKLDLSQNQLNGSVPLDFVQTGSAGFTVLINVSFNLLHGNIPAPAVRVVPTVAPAPAPGAIDRGINYSTPSFSLDLSHNRLEGPVPLQIYRITTLDVTDNLLSGDIVDVLAESQAFQSSMGSLHLANNHFTGDLTTITFDWADWSALKEVDLSNNSLSWRPTESIPDPVGAALGNFRLVRFLASSNNFSGTSLPFSPLSRAIGSLAYSGGLKYLSELDLSYNELHGEISGDVFTSTWMPSLQLLNLSNNQATGGVPESITTLSNLISLDLSNNKLSGQLPAIPPNSLINPRSIDGNPGLCGSFLEACAPQQTGVPWWKVLLIVGGSSVIMVGASCVVATWRWRVYRKRHQQDADLIRTLMERELVTLMPMRHLRKATDSFAETARIGEGGFGTVYRGNLNDGTTVAIKRSKREGSKSDKEQFLNEVRILSHVNHRHLVKLLGCCMENKVALLVFEFVSNGTLQEHLRGKVGNGRLSWKQRLTIAVQTSDALNYLHSAATFPIYHRDVKSANILLSDDLSAKVADFGISKLVPAEASHFSTARQGTLGYMDPEYWTSFQLTDKSDVYSFGVVLLELISAMPAIIDLQRGGEKTSLVLFANPRIKSGDMEPLIDPALMETYSDPDGRGRASILSVGKLAMKCLNMRAKARPSMSEVSKELLKLWIELTGTSMKEGLGYTNEEDNDDDARQVVFLSHILSSDSWSSRVQNEPRSFELSEFSQVLTLGSKSMEI